MGNKPSLMPETREMLEKMCADGPAVLANREHNVTVLRARIGECEAIQWLIKDRRSIDEAYRAIQHRLEMLESQLALMTGESGAGGK